MSSEDFKVIKAEPGKCQLWWCLAGGWSCFPWEMGWAVHEGWSLQGQKATTCTQLVQLEPAQPWLVLHAKLRKKTALAVFSWPSPRSTPWREPVLLKSTTTLQTVLFIIPRELRSFYTALIGESYLPWLAAGSLTTGKWIYIHLHKPSRSITVPECNSRETQLLGSTTLALQINLIRATLLQTKSLWISPRGVPGQKMSGTAALPWACWQKTGTASSYSKAQEKE